MSTRKPKLDEVIKGVRVRVYATLFELVLRCGAMKVLGYLGLLAGSTTSPHPTLKVAAPVAIRNEPARARRHLLRDRTVLSV
jgi:hypothetical protein